MIEISTMTIVARVVFNKNIMCKFSRWMSVWFINNKIMLYEDRIDVSEGMMLIKKVHQKCVMFVTIGFLKIIVLSFNQMSAIDVTIY